MRYLFVCILPLFIQISFASDNIVGIEANGGRQSDRPVTISRVFKRGDISNYAQPVLNGKALSTWQCDVKVRWRDAAASRTITAIERAGGANPAANVFRVVAPSHGFLDGERVTISGVKVFPEVNGSWTIVNVTANSFNLAKSTVSAPSLRDYRFRGTAPGRGIPAAGVVTGPDYGSVKHGLISFVASFGKSSELTFRDNPASSSGGSPLDQAAMLNFDAGRGNGSWGAAIEATQGNTVTINARSMLGGGHWRYWLRGPVVTQVIVEDRSPALSYDFGWQSGNNWKPAGSDKYRSLHPIFVLTFYPGWQGVKIDYILENDWTTRLQDQSYSLALRSGPSLDEVKYSRPEFTHNFASRWRKTYWDGNEPGELIIDPNLAYLRETGAVPYFDVENVHVTDSDIAKALKQFKQSDGGDDYGDAGQYLRAFQTTGGRPEIGWFPRWFVQYLYHPTADSWDVFQGNMDVGGHIPMHYREAARGKVYDEYDTEDAFGRPLSLTARPTAFIPYYQNTYWHDSYVAPADNITPVGTTSWNSWSVDLAHSSSFAYVPYILTGDWYLLEELQFWAAHAVAMGNPRKGVPYGHGREWGILNPSGVQPRGVGWGLRTLLHAAFISPQGTPEERYFRRKVAANAQAWEGRLNITDGHFVSGLSCDGYANGTQNSEDNVNDIGCFGRKVMESGLANPLYFPASGTAWGYCWEDPYTRARFNCSLSDSVEQNYMDHFIMLAIGESLRMGFDDFSASFEKLEGHYIDRALYPDNAQSRQFLLSSYSLPVLNGDDSSYLTTWSALNAVLTKRATTLTQKIGRSDTSFTVSDGSGLIAFYSNKPLRISNAVSRGKNTDLHITGHGVNSKLKGQRIKIVGGSGSWAAMNGVYWLTYVDANTLSIPFNSSGLPAYGGGAEATLNIVASGYNELRIDNELMRVCAVLGNTVYIGPAGDTACPGPGYRGSEGTSAASHDKGAEVAPAYDYWQWLTSSEGYTWMARTTLSYALGTISPGGYTGDAAWNWIDQQLSPHLSVLNGDPRWAIIPDPNR